MKVLHFICPPLAAASAFAVENAPTAPASAASSLPPSGASMEAANALLERAGVPRKTRAGLQAALATLDERDFEYPWNGLEEAVTKMPENKLSLVGYGSLLNRDSAAKTIKDTPPEGHPPVLALGARRIFNYVMPEELLEDYRKRYGGNFLPRERAALNVDYTGSPADALNGRLLTVSTADFEDLRKREPGYDLRPVVYVRWGEWDAVPFTGYVVVGFESVAERKSACRLLITFMRLASL